MVEHVQTLGNVQVTTAPVEFVKVLTKLSEVEGILLYEIYPMLEEYKWPEDKGTQLKLLELIAKANTLLLQVGEAGLKEFNNGK